MSKEVTIKLKYDDGKTKVKITVAGDEMEDFLEREYQMRLFEAAPEDKAKIHKMTPEEYVQSLNRESYNNWHKLNRHTSNPVINVYAQDAEEQNPLDFIEDKNAMREVDEREEIEEMVSKMKKCLSDKQIKLLLDVYVHEIPIAEIAEMEGVSHSAICQRLKVAKKYFKQFFPKPSNF